MLAFEFFFTLSNIFFYFLIPMCSFKANKFDVHHTTWFPKPERNKCSSGDCWRKKQCDWVLKCINNMCTHPLTTTYKPAHTHRCIYTYMNSLLGKLSKKTHSFFQKNMIYVLLKANVGKNGLKNEID